MSESGGKRQDIGRKTDQQDGTALFHPTLMVPLVCEYLHVREQCEVSRGKYHARRWYQRIPRNMRLVSLQDDQHNAFLLYV